MARRRTFIGVDIGDAIRASVTALQKDMGRAVAGVKWAAPEGMHVTLLFLGDVDDRELPAICRAVAAAAAGERPFEVRAAGVGAFPNARRPKVVWAGVSDGADALGRLHAALEGEMRAFGYRSEERGYTPHLTLGRVNTPEAAAAVAAELPKRAGWAGGRVAVSEVLVYDSEMRSDGPVYTVVGRAALGG